VEQRYDSGTTAVRLGIKPRIGSNSNKQYVSR